MLCRYESVWEGDSFIIAFHSPAAALHFCMDVQHELLALPWPRELLQCSLAEEVWCAPGSTSQNLKRNKSKLSVKSSDVGLALETATSSTIRALVPAQAETSSQVALRAQSSILTDTTTDESTSDLTCAWKGQWKRCSAGTAGAVLAYRGLRVRLGLHAGVADASAITFNSVMQRYHYTGALHVACRCMHGAHACMLGKHT